MIIKVLGSLLIIVSSTVMGYLYASKGKFRATELRKFADILMKIKSEIGYQESSLPDIILKIAEKKDGKISKCFESMYKLFIKKSGKNLSDIWKESIKENLTNTYLLYEDLDRLEQIGDALSSNDINYILLSLESGIDYLLNKSKDILSGETKEYKIYTNVGMMLGMLIVVLLI